MASFCGVNRKTAAFYFLQLREVVAYEQKDGSDALFGGEIEVDENYFGGRRKGKCGRGAADKIPLFGLFKRSEKVYTKSIPDASGATLIPIIKRKVMPCTASYIKTAGEATTFWMCQNSTTSPLTILR